MHSPGPQAPGAEAPAPSGGAKATDPGLRPLAVALWLLAGSLLLLVWSYPHVMSRLRAEQGTYARMTPGCDPLAGACKAAFADGTEVRLAVATSTVPSQRRFTFRVEAASAPRTIELVATNMNIGLFRLPLHPEGAGRWGATTHLPLCTMDRMLWRAEVVLEDRVAAFTFASDGR